MPQLWRPRLPLHRPLSGLRSRAITNAWRGLFTLSLGFTLCAIAIAESTGAANAPAWFLGFAIPVLTEWVGEWVVYGRRKVA